MKTKAQIETEIAETEKQRLSIVSMQQLSSANIKELLDIDYKLTEKIKRLKFELTTF